MYLLPCDKHLIPRNTMRLVKYSAQDAAQFKLPPPAFWLQLKFSFPSSSSHAELNGLELVIGVINQSLRAQTNGLSVLAGMKIFLVRLACMS